MIAQNQNISSDFTWCIFIDIYIIGKFLSKRLYINHIINYIISAKRSYISISLNFHVGEYLPQYDHYLNMIFHFSVIIFHFNIIFNPCNKNSFANYNHHINSVSDGQFLFPSHLMILKCKYNNRCRIEISVRTLKLTSEFKNLIGFVMIVKFSYWQGFIKGVKIYGLD